MQKKYFWSLAFIAVLVLLYFFYLTSPPPPADNFSSVSGGGNDGSCLGEGQSVPIMNGTSCTVEAMGGNKCCAGLVPWYSPTYGVSGGCTCLKPNIPQPPGAKCPYYDTSGRQRCEFGGSCGLPEAGADSSEAICCPKGKTHTYAGNVYCWPVEEGGACWSDDMCGNGWKCCGNFLGLRKGTCEVAC